MRWTTTLASAAIAVGGVAIAQPTVVLDDFDSNPNDELLGPRLISSQLVDDPFNQGGNFAVNTAFSFENITGAAIMNSGIGAHQRGVINYDNNGAGLNLDTDAFGMTGFQFEFLQVDLGFEMSIFAGSGGGNARLDGVAVGASLESQTVTVDFTSFTTDPGFDPTDVDAVLVTFNTTGNPTRSLDFILTEFRAVVPGPGGAALLAVAGAAGMRRRRR